MNDELNSDTSSKNMYPVVNNLKYRIVSRAKPHPSFTSPSIPPLCRPPPVLCKNMGENGPFLTEL